MNVSYILPVSIIQCISTTNVETLHMYAQSLPPFHFMKLFIHEESN